MINIARGIGRRANSKWRTTLRGKGDCAECVDRSSELIGHTFEGHFSPSNTA